MNNLTKLVAISLMSLSLPACSGTSYDTANVISATPITRSVHISKPQKECWNETVVTRQRGSDSYTPTIVGGIVGGVVGNQVGGGDGKTAATVAGTLLGGSIGRDYGNEQGRPVEREVRRCRTVDHGYNEERIDGYLVKYEYQGATYTTKMSSDPGDTIKVRIDTKVSPVVGR